jgi:site-specific recombinase XerD
VLAVSDEALAPTRFRVRKVDLPDAARESWTLVGPDHRRVMDADAYLAYLTNLERSPNTVVAYARDLKLFFSFLASCDLTWPQVRVKELADFVAWLRRPAENVVVLESGTPARDARTVNRVLTAVTGFYTFHARNGHELAQALLDDSRSGYGGYKPFLHGIAKPKPRAKVVRLAERQVIPKALTIEQVNAVIQAQKRLRDRFLFALLASTGMRIGQALGLRHEDIVGWENRIKIVSRSHNAAHARGKGGAGVVPVPPALIRLWNDYMHEEYGDIPSDYVFVNLWGGHRGRPMTRRSVEKVLARTRRDVGFHFWPHQFRHTYATLAVRDGVQLEVVSTLLTHASVESTRIYTHATADDLRRALKGAGVLDKVEDLV